MRFHPARQPGEQNRACSRRGTLLLTAGVAVLGFAFTLVLPEPAGISLEEMSTTTRDRRARSLRVARQHQPTEDPASAA